MSAKALLLVLPGGALLLGELIMHLGAWVLAPVAIVAFGLVVLHRLDWGLYALIFVLPFMSIEGTHVTLIQQFKRVLVVGLIAAWAVQVLIGKRTVRVYWPVLGPLVVLLVAALVSILRAPALDVALTSTGRMVAYAMAYVVVVADVLRDPVQIWRGVRVLLTSATLVSAFALYQFAAHFLGWPTFLNSTYETQYVIPRVHSVMQEPLWLSNYLLLVFPIALALCCWRDRPWPRQSFLAAGAAGLAILVAASRLGWASLFLVGVLFVLLGGSQIRPVRMVALAGLPLLAVTVGAALMLRNFGSTQELGRYVTDFATFATNEHGVGDLRWHIRLLGLFPEAIRTSPVIGIGANNVGYEFYGLMPIAGPQISSTHNTYLDLLIETGGIGAVSFLLVLGAAFRSAWKRFRELGPSREGGLSLGIALGLLGMAFHLANWSGWREAHIWFSVGLAVAASQTFSACRPAKAHLSRAESHHGG